MGYRPQEFTSPVRFGTSMPAHPILGQKSNYKYGLVVDRFHDSEEIVVKPVGRHLKEYQAYAGATILGDGKVSLILDILNLAQMSGLSTVSESNQLSERLQQGQASEYLKESIVVFKNLETEYFAASFEYVQRIERFSTASIERIGNRNVVQYRGGALPLYQMSQIIDVEYLPERELQEVVVFSVNGREFGLMVTPPVDILEVHFDIDTRSFEQPGVKGTMNINGHTTLIVDILEMADSFLGEVLLHD
jgi:two-component system chemotaxis sensor kinase CheA